MHQYSTLSNAKFNHHKTEAFSLNGRCDDRWSRLLLHHSIAIYHHRDSPAPFRYLGFSIGYTKDHQQQILSTLLANVRKQVGIYSTRNLSIKGKVTVLHSLILSKIWYCLRILVAPQSFFKTLAGICRAFVHSEKPLISYAQMCQPHCQGGLGLMDPQKQQLGMQFRWLNILLQPQQYPSFLGPIMLHHLHLAQDPMDSPFLPLLWPTLRRGALLDSRHSASLWFAAFDSIPIPVNISKASLATCLTIPLFHLCQGVPQDYWLNSAPHRRQPASLCLRYDPDNNRLCVKSGSEMTSFPTLSRRFLQDIYHQWITWDPAITAFLTAPSIDYGVVDYSPIIKAWVEDPFWQTFQVRAYRFLSSSMSTTTVKFSKSSIQLFWSAPMQPQARTVWYKILINKAPLQAFLAMIHPSSSKYDVPALWSNGRCAPLYLPLLSEKKRSGIKSYPSTSPGYLTCHPSSSLSNRFLVCLSPPISTRFAGTSYMESGTLIGNG
ncbi:hypothetical protein [Absidia glauca]|uniref:Reverse transcriptase zinc-binding domain-containing protein n=1 Tax=Absidia glauca TaxID=4829 RepID=A0A163J0D7_ABSGL|nr:hypothetical protein [Absidia glauca]